MSYRQRDMGGSLFKNDRKTSPKHPNLTGSALIDGVEYWVSGWTREKNGDKWISLAFKAKRDEQRPAKKVDEDIPW